MVHRNINDIEMPYFLWRKMVKTKKVNKNIAFDTETINGRCFLIADSEGISLNDNEFNDLSGLLSFLNSKKYRNTNNWFYNLEYDTNAIIHFLSYEDRKFIANFNYVDYDKYRIQIVPRKELKISVLKDDKIYHTTAFYDLAQFYNFNKLATLAETTQYDKVYVKDISQINKNMYYDNSEYHKLINTRCIIDAKIAKVKADELTNNINKVVKINAYRSNASIARSYVLKNISHNLKMPSIKLLDVALQAYHAGHIETCKIGLFNNVHNYDIKSAYPSFIANLYETNGAYIHNKEYIPETAYSFYNIEIDYDNDHLSPLWYLKSGNNYHANGKFDVWVTQPELEYFIEKGYDFVIMDGYHIEKDYYTEKPFYNLIHDLYNERLKAKDNGDEIELVYKVILNSIYGVTLNTIMKKILSDYETDLYELKDGKLLFYEKQYIATNMYNPVFGTYITAGTRAKIFSDFGKNAEKIISINTDGVYMTNTSNVSISKKLGEYGYKNLNKLMVMGSGRYFLLNNNIVDNKESRFRSIPLKTSDIYKLMQKHKNEKKLEVVREKPIKLKEFIKSSKHYGYTFSSFPIQDYYLKDNFNVFREDKKDITFANHRRHWFNDLEKIEDLWNTQYESRPFNIGEIK